MPTVAWSIATLLLVSGVGTRWHLPVTVEVLRDVPVEASAGVSHESRGILNTWTRNAKSFQIKAGDRFQMIKIYAEGECRIRFKNGEYDISSCPWLDGFTDHQTDIFRVLTPPRQ